MLWVQRPAESNQRLYNWYLLVKETGGLGENHRTVSSHWQTISHNVYKYTLPWSTSVVLGTDFIGSCKSNYHTITGTTALTISCVSIKVQFLIPYFSSNSSKLYHRCSLTQWSKRAPLSEVASTPSNISSPVNYILSRHDI